MNTSPPSFAPNFNSSPFRSPSVRTAAQNANISMIAQTAGLSNTSVTHQQEIYQDASQQNAAGRRAAKRYERHQQSREEQKYDTPGSTTSSSSTSSTSPQQSRQQFSRTPFMYENASALCSLVLNIASRHIIPSSFSFTPSPPSTPIARSSSSTSSSSTSSNSSRLRPVAGSLAIQFAQSAILKACHTTAASLPPVIHAIIFPPQQKRVDLSAEWKMNDDAADNDYVADNDTTVKAIITFANENDKAKIIHAINGIDAGIATISEYKEPMVKGTIRTSISLHPFYFEQLQTLLQSQLPTAIITSANADHEGLFRLVYFSIPAKDQHHLLRIPTSWSEGPGGHIKLLTLVQDKHQASLACPRCFSCEHKLHECKLPKDKARCGLCGKEGHLAGDCNADESERVKQCLVCRGTHLTLSCNRLHPDRKPMDKHRLQQLADRAAAKSSARQSHFNSTSTSSHPSATSVPTPATPAPATYSSVATASLSSPPLTTDSAPLNSVSSSTHSAHPSAASPSLEFQRMWKAIDDIKQRQEEQELRQVDMVESLMNQNMNMIAMMLDKKMNMLMEQVVTQVQSRLAITHSHPTTTTSNNHSIITTTQRSIRHLPDDSSSANSSHKAQRNNQTTDAAQSSRNHDTNTHEQQPPAAPRTLLPHVTVGPTNSEHMCVMELQSLKQGQIISTPRPHLTSTLTFVITSCCDGAV